MAKIPYQLLANGPIRTEARRIAKEMIKKELDRKRVPHQAMSEKQWDNLITVALWNNGEHLLKVAQCSLGERK